MEPTQSIASRKQFFAFEIDKSIPHELAACSILNPVSALALMERLKQLKAKTVVQIRLGPIYKMQFINIVRRKE